MRQFIVFVLVVVAFQLNAQVGISASYLNQNVPEWEAAAAEVYGNEVENNFLNSGFEVGVDYWFRLKNFRIEFFPTASFSNFNTTLDNPFVDVDFGSQEGVYSQTSFGLHLKTNIYPLDFEGDCDCPTWKKDGNIIKKGWFVQLIGGGKSMSNKYEFDTVNFSESTNSILFEAGVGTGLDIGVSEFLTVTPYINYIWTFNAEWQEFEKLSKQAVGFPTQDDLDLNPTDMNRLVFGIRLGFRFDELNKYGYR